MKFDWNLKKTVQDIPNCRNHLDLQNKKLITEAKHVQESLRTNSCIVFLWIIPKILIRTFHIIGIIPITLEQYNVKFVVRKYVHCIDTFWFLYFSGQSKIRYISSCKNWLKIVYLIILACSVPLRLITFPIALKKFTVVHSRLKKLLIKVLRDKQCSTKVISWLYLFQTNVEKILFLGHYKL